MDLEEAKKIIQNKIVADETAREVRSQIKTYIHEKQNLREGFTETFKPLIETSEKVKESIDTQQNKLIKQLQENQLALTQGFEGNRKAITSGFVKMDEVKKWDLEQLPGYEASSVADEEPEKEDEGEENIILKLNERIKNKLVNMENLNILAKKATDEGDFTLGEYYLDKIKEEDDSIKKIQKNIKRLQKTSEEKSDEKQEPSKRIISFDDTDLDSGLNNVISIRFLEENDLLLPSRIRNESYETIKRYQRKAERLANEYKKLLANKAEFKISKGKNKAVAINKNPRTETLQEIQYYNILGEYVNNMNKLENIAKKKRTRNHPLQQPSTTCRQT